MILIVKRKNNAIQTFFRISLWFSIFLGDSNQVPTNRNILPKTKKYQYFKLLMGKVRIAPLNNAIPIPPKLLPQNRLFEYS
ncbi:hypothetical protein COV18_06730 [Candidatus Woesearchaeota archaeon CG10_big_fil_rev_8_21_14_0_10_37_12]|nr:MAG: hypothetical protein COV18_06730 [Candidatus Woesearchaeota archaeon CG10_big_fil_rev_8_21_14_0_10_37_12]